MAKNFRFLQPYLNSRIRPPSASAFSAHVRFYTVISSGKGDIGTSELQWRQTLVEGAASPPAHLHPRIATDHRAMSCRDFANRYSMLGRDEVKHGETVILRGRVYSHRSAGMKLLFVDLQQAGQPVQVVCNHSKMQEGASEAEFRKWCSEVQRGDIYSFRGLPHRTTRGELSLLVTELPELLSPCLHPFPTELSDQETKVRNRHLDLWTSRKSVQTLLLRSDILRHIRHFLEADGFREVQTPILANEAGGAVARAFHTNATEFPERRISLRIAPELWLKRLVLGGLDKVFEIGPCFRNEGLDLNHNPEYTTCEFYQAYANLEDLISLTEKLFASLASLTRALIPTSYPHLPALDIDFNQPFTRLEFIPALERALDRTLPDLSTSNATSDLLSLFESLNIAPPSNPTQPRLLDRLSAIYLEPASRTAPTFITHHPESLSPLSKSFLDPQTNQRVAARAELFLKGQELVNMYEEENSPFEQRRKFESQLKYKKGDDESSATTDGSSSSSSSGASKDGETAKKGAGGGGGGAEEINESYLEALEWGLPPTGGWGCGIDRLCMLFSGAERIADVLPFGNLRNVVGLGRGWRRK